MYDPDANYTHQVVDISALRTNLMRAENALEIEGQGPETKGHTVTGTIVAMLDPANPDAADGAPGLAGVTVTVGEQVATTDANGVFTLSLENGTYESVIHYANGYDRTVTINVNGADINAGTITMIPCDYDGNGYVNYADTIVYFGSVDDKDTTIGDFNNDGYVNYQDTLIYFTFVDVGNIQNLYTAVVIG